MRGRPILDEVALWAVLAGRDPAADEPQPFSGIPTRRRVPDTALKTPFLTGYEMKRRPTPEAAAPKSPISAPPSDQLKRYWNE
ncbi:hypothetical protein [Nonomuraea sp. B1E8]|uniref:hypothetical protein n=1 Tax=unclassified Nonomuraea TaxID=2593643 RepID=UPI00325DDA49